ncbi:hypothetical protein JKP88DRAFT_206701 [Tribonema minus]|uniref:Uncharacterized protein n=1 Tax=Tribonema minus TaxID=303371 RepID=A0A835Z999_9STRA|nr:hypothetical protein JKP88DRAFT_206701 [Tribonema minus]
MSNSDNGNGAHTFSRRTALGICVSAAAVLQQRQQAHAALEPLPPPKSYTQQIVDAIPIKTIRGVWRIREIREGESLCKGKLTFKGFVDEPGKGTVEYVSSDGEREGKGYWLLKPGSITAGKILFSARWKVTYKGGGGSFLYRGDVVLDSTETLHAAGNPHPDAHIRGEVLKPFKGRTGSLQEKHIGEFEADLLQVDKDEDKL